ncbi:hypothetical protein [Lachnotalea glycerini]|uniref:Uncharacterized protein n=1 Tax=Lachnotalea glycerini TaxID=1763509 RepID=A0A371JCL7_9FIRM|nr:hypothetical protein [Lachnotalea glycerini]RDY30416.1 hypothetical protein CG710_014930 [Lachnotalea glycerini]
MFKGKRIFLIVLSTLILIGAVSTPISAATYKTIYAETVNTRTGVEYFTPTFVLNTSSLHYHIKRRTYGSYITRISLQVYTNGKWNTKASASTSGSTSKTGDFTNLETGLSYRVVTTTTDPSTKYTNLTLSEVYE